LEGVVRRWSADTGIPASTTVTGEAFGLHPEGEVTLLRSAQEALANVRRHAGASQVQVTLSYLPDLVMLDVRDDGVGMDPAALPRRHVEGGFGLEAMRQRAERAGGRLTVESTPGEGTAIAVALPVGAAQGEGVAS
jgi:signal transduction histidine kinase